VDLRLVLSVKFEFVFFDAELPGDFDDRPHGVARRGVGLGRHAPRSSPHVSFPAFAGFQVFAMLLTSFSRYGALPQKGPSEGGGRDPAGAPPPPKVNNKRPRKLRGLLCELCLRAA